MEWEPPSSALAAGSDKAVADLVLCSEACRLAGQPRSSDYPCLPSPLTSLTANFCDALCMKACWSSQVPFAAGHRTCLSTRNLCAQAASNGPRGSSLSTVSVEGMRPCALSPQGAAASICIAVSAQSVFKGDAPRFLSVTKVNSITREMISGWARRQPDAYDLVKEAGGEERIVCVFRSPAGARDYDTLACAHKAW